MAKKGKTVSGLCQFKGVSSNGDKISIGVQFARHDLAFGVADKILCESMGDAELRCDPNNAGDILNVPAQVGKISVGKKLVSFSLKFNLESVSAGDAKTLLKFAGRHGKLQFTKTASLDRAAAESGPEEDEDEEATAQKTIPLAKAQEG